MTRPRAIDDPAAVLRAIQGKLSAQAERGRLGELVRRLRHRSTGGEPLPLQEDAETLRFLFRLGVVSNPHGSRSAKREIDRFLEQASRSGGPEPTVSSVLLRGYAAGIYGVCPAAVCSDSPKCEECPLTPICRSYSSSELLKPQYDKGSFPSERIVAEGPASLSSAELLALVAGATKAQEPDAVEACDRLLRGSGGLRGVSSLSRGEIEQHRLPGARAASAIAAAMEITRRWVSETRPVGRAFTSGRDFFDAYRLKLRDLKREVFVAVLLDQKNRFLADETCSEGSLTASLVHPREVFRRAVRESAAAIAFVHNHPSGDPTPSTHDLSITARLFEVSQLMGIRMLDHVVIGDSSYISLLEKGLMPQSGD